MNEARTAVKQSACDQCNDTGYVFVVQGAVRCACMAQLDARLRLTESQIPRKWRRYTLDDFEVQSRSMDHTQAKLDALEMCRVFVNGYDTIRKQPQNGLIFMGSAGAGKTMLACAVMHELVFKGYTGLFWNEEDLFVQLRGAMKDSAEEHEDDILGECQAADILLLDDVGKSKATEYVASKHYTIINRRYQAEKTLIVTTNQSMDWIGKHVGAPVQSRLVEMCTPVVCNWEDYRLKGWE